MKISLHWLKDYIAIPEDVEALASKLTFAGLEVEAIEEQAKPLDKFVVGEVQSCEKHPKADKLSLCTVYDGMNIHSVVCGAPNVATGQKVIFAQLGAVIPNGKFTIEKRKIRGAESSGMICSASELLLSDDHSGIMILPESTPVGISAAEYFEKNDIVFEIGITPNRIDALSHVGVARDMAALYGMAYKLPESQIDRDAIPPKNFVTIKNPELCPRYSAMIIRNVKVQDSPAWLRRRLEAVGLRSINNIVDVTNYVMYEIGHPMHAFDLSQVHGEHIIVRNATEGEHFVTLDGKARTLRADMLMICDTEKPVAIAGVMGGENSEITNNATDILLESAYFNPSCIRKTAKALSISTDSSYRFERGADPNATMWALVRAADLIRQIAGGVCDALCDVYPIPIPLAEISVRPSRVNKILGIEIERDAMIRILTSLGIDVREKEQELHCTIPSFRSDLEREIDLIEEIARINGYDAIPTPTTFKVSSGKSFDEMAFENRLRQICLGVGLDEAQSSSLVELGHSTVFTSEEKIVKVLNPVSEERPALRVNIITSLLENISHNVRNGNADVRMFEIGSVFGFRDESNSADPLSRYSERRHLAVAISGSRTTKRWYSGESEYDFFDAKGLFESICDHLHLDNYKFVSYDDSEALSKVHLAIEMEGTYVGHISELSKEICSSFDLKQTVFYFELSIEAMQQMYKPQQQFASIAKFPVVERDVAFVFDHAVRSYAVVEYVDTLRLTHLRSMQLVDVYASDQLGKNKKSLAFQIMLQASDHTLTEEEIRASMQTMIDGVSRQFQAVLRST